MIAPLIDPERETFPNRRRWTVAECYQLVEGGHLKGRYELIDGEIISKIGQKPPHRITLMLVLEWLVSQFSTFQVQVQLPIRIPGADGCYTEPEPDLAVTREPATAYIGQHPGPEDLVVAVEVAESSLEFDLTTKALLYARAGIPEYWVADVVGKQIHIHRHPSADGYRWLQRADLSSVVSLDAQPSDTVHVSSFFPQSIYVESTETSATC